MPAARSGDLQHASAAERGPDTEFNRRNTTCNPSAALALAARCSWRAVPASPRSPLARGAQWGLVPLLNYSQGAAGDVPSRSCSAGRAKAMRPRLYGRPQGDLRWSTTASASSARWTGHASRSWPTWSRGVEERARTAWTASRRWASACRCWSRPPGGCSGAPAGRAWSRESLAGAAQKVLREAVGDLRLGDGDVRAQGFHPRTARQRQCLLGRDAGHQRARAGPGLVVQPGRPAAGQRHLSLGDPRAPVAGHALRLRPRPGQRGAAGGRAVRVPRPGRRGPMPRYRRPSSSACCSAPCWWASSATSGNAAWSAWSWRTSTASCASTNSPAPITSCASPDRLEQRVAGNDQSLRSSLLGLRQLLRERRARKLRSMRWRKPCWRCWPSTVRCASPDSTGCATAPRSRNPWRRSARCRRWTPTTCWCAPAWSGGELSVRQELLEARRAACAAGVRAAGRHRWADPCPAGGGADAVLRLQRTFSLLAILAGHVADLLQSDRRALQLADIDAQRFSQYLKRSLLDARDHGLPAPAADLTDARYGEEVQRLLEGSQRGLGSCDCATTRPAGPAGVVAADFRRRLQYLRA